MGQLQRERLDAATVDLEELVEVVRLGARGRAVELDAREARRAEELEHRAEVPGVEPHVQVLHLADHARRGVAPVDVPPVDVQVLDALEQLEHGLYEVDMQVFEAQSLQWAPCARGCKNRAG